MGEREGGSAFFHRNSAEINNKMELGKTWGQRERDVSDKERGRCRSHQLCSCIFHSVFSSTCQSYVVNRYVAVYCTHMYVYIRGQVNYILYFFFQLSREGKWKWKKGDTILWHYSTPFVFLGRGRVS